jgi:hypothetical protein
MPTSDSANLKSLKARAISRKAAKHAKRFPDRLLGASGREIFLPNEKIKPIFIACERAASRSPAHISPNGKTKPISLMQLKKQEQMDIAVHIAASFALSRDTGMLSQQPRPK